MNKTEFIPNFLECCRDEGYAFLCPIEQFAEPKQMSYGKQAMFAAGAAAALGAVFGGGAIVGAIAGSNVGYAGHTKQEIVSDLESMRKHCDLVGMNVSSGASVVRAVIDADEIQREALIGRFAMIHECVHTFRKYSMVIVKNWIWGDTTAGTSAQVFVLFSSHKDARDFTQHYGDKCRHRALRKAVYTYPYIVDLEDEEITILHYGLMKFSAEKLKAALFKKRA